MPDLDLLIGFVIVAAIAIGIGVYKKRNRRPNPPKSAPYRPDGDFD